MEYFQQNADNFQWPDSLSKSFLVNNSLLCHHGFVFSKQINCAFEKEIKYWQLIFQKVNGKMNCPFECSSLKANNFMLYISKSSGHLAAKINH